MEISIDSIAGSWVKNKDSEKADGRLYKILENDFSKLKGMWSKSFFMFILERAEDERLKRCGARLKLTIEYNESMTYNRYISPIRTELKKATIMGNTQYIIDHILESMMTYGDEEYIILNKILFNCLKPLYHSKNLTRQLPMATKNKIETDYDIYRK